MISAQFKCIIMLCIMLYFAHITNVWHKSRKKCHSKLLLCQERWNNAFFQFFAKRQQTNQWKKTKIFHESKIQDSRSLGGTSRVVLELKPFGISIRGLIGSEPWVGRSTGKMSRNSNEHIVFFSRNEISFDQTSSQSINSAMEPFWTPRDLGMFYNTCGDLGNQHHSSWFM